MRDSKQADIDLFEAVVLNNKAGVKAALAAGANINAVDTSPGLCTPLQRAILAQHKKMAEFLATVPGTTLYSRTSDHTNVTALDLAAQYKYYKLAISILKHYGNDLPKYFMYYHYGFDIAKLICEYLFHTEGVDLANNPFTAPAEFHANNITADKLNHLLAHLAAYDGNAELLATLIERDKINVNYIQPAGLHGSGNSLLGTAAWNGNLDVVKLLVEHGANIEQIQGDTISTPRRYAKTASSRQSEPKEKYTHVIQYFNELIQSKKPEHEWLAQDIAEVSAKQFEDNIMFKRFIALKKTIDIPSAAALIDPVSTIYIELHATDKSGIFKLEVFMLNQQGAKEHIVKQEIQRDTFSNHLSIPGVGDVNISIRSDDALRIANYTGINPIHISACGVLELKNISSKGYICAAAKGYIQTMGEVTADGAIHLTTPKGFVNEDAKLVSKKQIHITARSTDNSNGLIASMAGDVILHGRQHPCVLPGDMQADKGRVYFSCPDGSLEINSTVTSAQGIYAQAQKIAINQACNSAGNIKLFSDELCAINASLQAKKYIMAYSNKITVADSVKLKSIKDTFLVANHDMDLNGKIQTERHIGILAGESIKYDLFKLEAKEVVELKIPRVCDFQFPENVTIEDQKPKSVWPGRELNSAISYELIGNDLAPIVIPHNILFAKELRIKAVRNEIIIGFIDKKVIVSALEKMLFNVKNLNVLHGGLFARKVLSIRSTASTKVGYLDFNAKPAFGEYLPYLPSFIATEDLLLVSCGTKLEVHCGEVLSKCGAAWFSGLELESIGGNITTFKDCQLDIKNISHSVIYSDVDSGVSTTVAVPTRAGFASKAYTHHGVHVKTPTALFACYGTVNLIPDTEISIVGGLFYYGKLYGASPANVQHVHQVLATQYVNWNGHKREKNCRWNSEERLVNTGERHYPGRVATMGAMNIEQTAQLTKATGDLIAGQIHASINSMEIGEFSHNVNINLGTFTPIARLFENERRSFLNIIATPGSKYYMDSSVPFTRLDIARMSPVVLLPEGKISINNNLGIPLRYDASKEIEALFPKLINMLGNINLSGENLTPQQVWFKLQQNAHKWVKANPKFKTSVTKEQLADIVEPMLIYAPQIETDAFGNQHEVLDLLLVMPKHLANLKLLSGAGGWFAKIINVEGTSLKLRGFMQAEEKLLVDLSGTLILEKHQYHKTHSVSESRVERDLLAKKTRYITKNVTDIINQIGAEMLAGEVSIKVGHLESHGGKIIAEKGNVEIIAADAVDLNTADGIYYTEHTASGKTFLKRMKVTEQLQRHIINATTICAAGNVLIRVETGNFEDTAAVIMGKNVTLVVKKGDRISKCKVVAEEQGTTFEKTKGKLILTETHVMIERGLGSMFIAEEKLAQEASGKIDLTGATNVAKEIYFKATRGVRIAPQVLNNYIVSRTTGMANAFTYVDAKTETKVQKALQPVIAGFKKLDVEAEAGSVEFQSTTISGDLHSKFIATAKGGDIRFTAVKLETISKTTTKTVGITFTGSQAIASAIEGKTGEALKKLAGEVPLFAPLVALGSGGKPEDMMAQAMLATFTTYNEYTNGAFSNGLGGFNDYVLSQFGIANVDGKLQFDPKSLKVSVRFGIDIKTEHSTEILAGTIAAWDMVFKAARDIDFHSVHIDGKTLNINAGGSAHIVADAAEHSERTKGVGVSAGVSGSGYSGGIDANYGTGSHTKYRASMFNVTDSINITANEKLEIRGSILQTAKAFISAKNLLVETLLDEEKRQSVSASIGTGGDVGFKCSSSRAKWASTQAGIHAAETMYIDVQGEVKLKGGVLAVDEHAKPLVTEFGDQLYELQMPQDGDDLFHALGVSRIKAAKDLLDHVNNTHIRTLVTNDICRLFKAGHLPQFVANDAVAKALFERFNAIEPEAIATPELEQQIREYCSKLDVYEAFIAFYVGVEGSNLTINCTNTAELGTIDALAEINNLALKTWIKDADGTLKLHHAHNPNDVKFEVNLFASVVDNAGTNRINYNLLSADPMLAITPVVTFEDVTGYKKGAGFGVQATGLYNVNPKMGGDGKEKAPSAKPAEPNKGNKVANNFIIPTMFRSNQGQVSSASVTGKASFVKRSGEKHDLAGAVRSGDTQTEGKKHSTWFGAAVPGPGGTFSNGDTKEPDLDQGSAPKHYSAGDVVEEEEDFYDNIDVEEEDIKVEPKAAPAKKAAVKAQDTAPQKAKAPAAEKANEDPRAFNFRRATYAGFDDEDKSSAQPLFGEADSETSMFHQKYEDAVNYFASATGIARRGAAVDYIGPSDFVRKYGYVGPRSDAIQSLHEGIGNSFLIGTGRFFVESGQGINQLGLQLGERMGIVDHATYASYTQKIDYENRIYRSTPVANSVAGKIGEYGTGMLVYSVIPGGAALRGSRVATTAGTELLFNYRAIAATGALSGGLISGIQPVYDGSWASRGVNTVFGAAVGAVAAPALVKVGDVVGRSVVRRYEAYAHENRNLKISQRHVFKSESDPLLRSMGDAKISHPEEYTAIMNDLRNHKVDVIFNENAIAFGPNIGGGTIGNQIHLPEQFSISALRHEYGHFLDHKSLGYPKFIDYMKNPSFRVQSERRQYLQEIRSAKDINDQISRQTLIKNYLNERADIVDKFYQKKYGEYDRVFRPVNKGE